MDGELTITRRGLLTGLLALGAATACTPRGSPAPAARSSTPSTRPSAGAQLRIGLIGAGGQGRALASRVSRDGRVELLTICDPDSKRAASLAATVERGGSRRPDEVADLRRVLDDQSIDAVVIATPHHWHALAAIWALQTGKHVYLEKPATHSLAEGEPLLEAATASGRVVEVGTQRRSHPGLAEAVAALHGGAIGTVTHARCYSWKRRRPIGPLVAGTWPNTMAADLWYGPRPIVPPVRESFHYHWHWFHDYGNGGLGNNGVHRLDVARWGLRLPTQATGAVSLAGRLGPADSGQTANTALTIVQYPGATVAHDLRGLRTTPTERHDPVMSRGDEVVFVGEGASIVVNRTSGRLVDSDGRVVRRYRADAGGVDPTARHVRQFVTACLAEDPKGVVVGPAEGVAAAAMCHAPTAAHRSVPRSMRSREVDQMRAVVHDLCGPAMELPIESFLAHVRSHGEASDLTWTGLRHVDGAHVEGGPTSLSAYPYRTGFRWEQ